MARSLIVDDSETVLEFAKGALEEDGHEIYTAKNGLEANKVIFSKQKPDLILLDVVMPMLNGDKVLKAFQQSEISKAIPVVFFSTKPEKYLTELVNRHKNMGFIRKPISAEDLCEEIKKLLD